MPTVTIRVTQETLKEIHEKSKNANLTVSDFMLKSALPGYSTGILSIGEIIDRAMIKSHCETFTISDLFSDEEWGSFSIGSRLSAGRLFFKYWSNNTDNIKQSINFKGKNLRNSAVYEKL